MRSCAVALPEFRDRRIIVGKVQGMKGKGEREQLLACQQSSAKTEPRYMVVVDIDDWLMMRRKDGL